MSHYLRITKEKSKLGIQTLICIISVKNMTKELRIVMRLHMNSKKKNADSSQIFQSLKTEKLLLIKNVFSKSQVWIKHSKECKKLEGMPISRRK